MKVWGHSSLWTWWSGPVDIGQPVWFSPPLSRMKVIKLFWGSSGLIGSFSLARNQESLQKPSLLPWLHASYLCDILWITSLLSRVEESKSTPTMSGLCFCRSPAQAIASSEDQTHNHQINTSAFSTKHADIHTSSLVFLLIKIGSHSSLKYQMY